MGRKYWFLILIMAVLCAPLCIVSANRPAWAATTPEVWDEEVPGEEGSAIDEPAIDEEDEVWSDEPEDISPDTPSEDEAPDAADEAPEPMPVPQQPAQ